MKNEIHMAGPWITEHEEKIVLDAMRNGWYGKAAYAYVEKFEAEFAAYHDRKYALMTPSCTTSIHLLLQGLGISDGDEVIAPECTWIASVAPVTYQRAKTIFADIDPETWCISAKAVLEKITPKTKAVIAVNLYGNMADMDALQKICDEHNIYLIEDAAESLGSTYKGVKSGKFGIGSVFSFHRTKTITTGEGGMLLLDDNALFERCKFLRDHGRAPGTYFNTEVTCKYMPSNLAASLGYAQFLRIDELVDKKRWIWQEFKKHFSNVPDVQLNPEPEGTFNGVWCTALVFGKSYGITKDYIMQELEKKGFPSRPFFYPLSLLPAFGGDTVKGIQNSPIAYDISERGINLPCALTTTEDQIAQMSNAIKDILENLNKKKHA